MTRGSRDEPGAKARPPEVPRRLVRWAVGNREADVVEGELLEAFNRHVQERGGARARLWYWRQAVGFLVRTGAARRGLPAGGGHRRGDGTGAALVGLGDVGGDLRWALRGLRRRPMFTSVVVATLALGIGANSAIFTLVSADFRAPLPYRDPGRLVLLWETQPQSQGETTVAPGNYFAWNEHARSFAAVAAYNVDVADLSGEGPAERVAASVVTPDFFSVLGVTPELGTTFSTEAARAADGNVALLGHALWVRRFGADPRIVGRLVRIDGKPHTVVGVMPARFRQPERSLEWQRPEIWRPLLLQNEHDDFGSRYLRTVARLQPGVTVEEARREMDLLATRMASAHPADDTGWGIAVRTLDDYLLGDAWPVLLMLLVAGAAVFLIVCANVANLTLARGQERRAEFAVRAALGSGRGRLLRQLAVESLVLALAGAAMGAVGVYLARPVLENVQERYFSGLVAISVDARVVAFTAVVALLAGILFALPQVRAASVPALRDALVDGRERSGTGRGTASTRSLLVVVQVALATTLLVVAALLMRSFDRLVAVPPGFDARGRLTFNLYAPEAGYPDRAAYVQYFREVWREIAAIPGVRAVAMTSDLPFTTENDWTYFGVEGRPYDENSAPRADFHVSFPEYFAVMGIPVLEGRLPADRWRQSSDTVVVVNRDMARIIAPAGDAAGATVVLHNGSDVMRLHVVAVVGNVLDGGYSAEPKPTFYVPYATWPKRGMSVVLRVEGNPARILPAVRRAVARVDPDIPAAGARTLDDLLAETVARPRAASLLGGVFALVAVLVAVTGIYGVLSHTVQRRTRELGVRAAMGASEGSLVSMILAQSGRLVAVGLVAGLAGALVAGRALSGLLFGVRAWDPPSFVGAATVVALMGLLAAWMPARRAAHVDPVEAIRTQ